MIRFRQGREVPNTLYIQLGDEPSKRDPFIGSCVSGDAAAILVRHANAQAAPADQPDAPSAEPTVTPGPAPEPDPQAFPPRPEDGEVGLAAVLVPGEFPQIKDPLSDGRALRALRTRRRVLEALRATDGTWQGAGGIAAAAPEPLNRSMDAQHMPALVARGLAESNGLPSGGRRYRRPRKPGDPEPEPQPPRAVAALRKRPSAPRARATAAPKKAATKAPPVKERRLVVPRSKASASIRRPALPPARPLRERPDAERVSGVATMPRRAHADRTREIQRTHEERQHGTLAGRAIGALGLPQTVAELARTLRVPADEADAVLARLVADGDVEVLPQRRRGFPVYRSCV